MAVGIDLIKDRMILDQQSQLRGVPQLLWKGDLITQPMGRPGIDRIICNARLPVASGIGSGNAAGVIPWVDLPLLGGYGQDCSVLGAARC